MSFEFYVAWYHQGNEESIKLSDILNVMSWAVAAEEDGVWHIAYDSLNSCEVFFSEKPTGQCNSLSINRPCGHPRLYDDILRLLKLGNGVMYWPGSRPVVAALEVQAHLPEGMIESLGQVLPVHSGIEIWEAVAQS